MAQWTISPCEGYIVGAPEKCTCEDGKFGILPSVPINTKFTITNENGGKTEYIKDVECITCNCSDISFEYVYHLDYKGRKIEDRYFNVAEHSNEVLGTISFKDGSGCNDIVKVSGNTGTTGFTDIHIEGNKVVASFPAYQQAFDATGRRLQFVFTINGTPCTNRYEIYQQAWKGTDNGSDYFANGFHLDYPILLCACGDPSDGDSIVAENGAWYYNPTDESFTEMDKAIFDGVYPNGVIINGWCKFTCADKNDPNPSARGICNVGMVHIEALSENPSPTEIRKASITLASVNRKDASPVNVASNAPAGWHPGEQCALKWTYDVWQLPRGYSMLYQDNGTDFELLTNEELQNCINYNNCKYNKREDCRETPLNCKK